MKTPCLGNFKNTSVFYTWAYSQASPVLSDFGKTVSPSRQPVEKEDLPGAITHSESLQSIKWLEGRQLLCDRNTIIISIISRYLLAEAHEITASDVLDKI